MKKIVIIAAVAAVIAAAAGSAAAFHAKYVILGNDLIAEGGKTDYDDIYRRDETEIWLSHRLNGFTASELNRCTALEDLMLESSDDAIMAKLDSFEHLHRLTFTVADETIAAECMAFISRQPALDTLLLFRTNADLSGIRSDTLREAVIFGGDITNIGDFANCPALEELCLHEIVSGDHLRRVDETDPAVNEYYTVADGEVFVMRPLEAVDYKFYLEDSSDFAALDQVKTLSFTGVTFRDISGFLEMNSLETLELDDCELSDADRKTLEDKGITVTEDVPDDT